MPLAVDHGRFERRRFLGLLGAGGLVAGGAVAGHVTTALPSQAAQANARENGAFAPPSDGRQQVVWSVDTTAPAVAFTFDDGPNPILTPRVLDLLAAVGAKATFFVIGQQVARQSALVRRIVGEGHELANHTWAHRSPALISAADTRSEIDRASDVLTSMTGSPPRWYRPPRGMLTGSAVEHAHRRGQSVAMWSVDRGPAADTDVDGVRRHLLDGLRPGAIIDLHDGLGASADRPQPEWPATLVRRRETELQALPPVLAAARDRSIHLVTLSDLVALGG